jgi:hypothetical protein
VMPGKGKIVEREYRADERVAIEEWLRTLTDSGRGSLTLNSGRTSQTRLLAPLRFADALPDWERPDAGARFGDKTLDVYLNGVAYWRNIPQQVWAYTIGGYQVIKKWLSYRERDLIGRGLRMDEARMVTAIARRIAVIIAMGRTLDRNYTTIKSDGYGWRIADS